ncbi:MAG: ABC transporter ATP-binding protein [Candidatus Obscuribacterales bacterium]|nr:ABC transporter ATP-binding protein [Candidatus Obscuribacterales bacterium]
MSDRPVCIKVENLVKSYGRGRVRALDDVSFEIGEGEIFGLIGPNGAGKTTLMGCLLTLLRPSSGRILIFGSTPDDLKVKAQCAFLPERPNFDAWMTARQFMHYHHMLAKRPASNAKEEVEEALRTVELDPTAWNRRVKKFSRGMLQRLGLAQMLLSKPRLCFLDEPGSGMDPIGANLLRNMLVAWKKQNVTVVLNSHHLDEVERVCDRVAFIKGGRIQQIEELSKLATEQISVLVKCSSSIELPEQALLNEISAGLNARFMGAEDSSLRFRLQDNADKVRLIRLLVEHQVAVEEVYQEKRGLEDMFISMHKEDGTGK